MLKELLPREVGELLGSKYNSNGVYEIRIRTGMPIYINYYGNYYPLKNINGQLVLADKRLIDFVLSRATDLSLYKYNNQIKNGYISVAGGLRIGVAGEIVLTESGDVKTIKNFGGIAIRIPHEIKGCSSVVMPYILDEGGVRNTLIISPPGCGKTTFLRDIARMISLADVAFNTLIIDERYEIAAAEGGINTLDVGSLSDVLSGCTKSFGFSGGIRALRPDVIITDEIATKEDAMAVKCARDSGVKVIASAHGFNQYDIKHKRYFNLLIEERTFDRFVILSDRKGVGTVEMILNSALEPIMVSE